MNTKIRDDLNKKSARNPFQLQIANFFCNQFLKFNEFIIIIDVINIIINVINSFRVAMRLK